MAVSLEGPPVFVVSTVKLFIHKLRAFLDYSNHKQFFLVKAFASITSAPPLEKTWLRACYKEPEMSIGLDLDWTGTGL